jgi:hypothetical protein
MANQTPISWKTSVGLNHVGAFQVSGRPFASGSVAAPVARPVIFPTVTKWVQVINHGNTPVKVGFSQKGVTNTGGGTNYFTVPASGSVSGPGSSPVLDVKISQLWISGSTSVDVVAGLTNIDAYKTNTDTGASWSGSAGVG